MHSITRSAIVAAAAVAALGVSVPAQAAPGDHGQGAGGCVDEIFGNATNPRPSGHGVLPSQSPGPWVNNPDDPDNPSWGRPLGVLIQQYDFTPADFRGAC